VFGSNTGLGSTTFPPDDGRSLRIRVYPMLSCHYPQKEQSGEVVRWHQGVRARGQRFGQALMLWS
jgi:hypothetical protein